MPTRRKACSCGQFKSYEACQAHLVLAICASVCLAPQTLKNGADELDELDEGKRRMVFRGEEAERWRGEV